MKEKNLYHHTLYIFCFQNNTEGMKLMLQTFDKIDVLEDEGILFKIAISKNNFEICKALLSFFENKQNPNQQQKDELKDILEEITSFSDISQEMQEVLEKYLPKEDFISEQDLSDLLGFDIEETFPQIEEHNSNANVTLSGNNYVLETH
jgi:uncharacterized protein YecA (UPF0149 family)